MSKGILIVSFGSTYAETREKNIGGIETYIAKRYPEMRCYRAFTSDMIRKVLSKRDQIEIMDVEQALRLMKADGITQVYIQPTHIIDGIENNKAKHIMQQYMSEFDYIGMGKPLLADEKDYDRVTDILWEQLLVNEDDSNLVLMGHGSEHNANEAYKKLENVFHKKGYANVYVATVEAKPTIEDVIKKLQVTTKKKVYLTPFMIVAGDHAHHDMAGGTDSFYTKLEEEGYETEIIMKGLGEYEEIRELFLIHLEELITKRWWL
jgi:sirohydrochlorin cobaltochelatase